MKENMICFVCRNCNCDNYTIYRGYLICEYCLEDWDKYQDFHNQNIELWAIEHKKKLDKKEQSSGELTK